MFATAEALSVDDDAKRQLESLVRSGTTPQGVAQKCRVILLAQEGMSNRSIAKQLGLSRPTVIAARATYGTGGVQALTAKPTRNRPRRTLTPELAKNLRVSRMMVHRVWQRFDIQPHRVEKFKLSNDPQFEEKVRDIAGLYLDPPERALVLCVDEKSQIQALDRTAPILPLRPGLPERQTHDYKRHGTTTLFAAFNILNGKVIGSCLPRHRGKEFAKFLNQVEKQVPPDLDVHIILDNYSTHKSATVKRWLKSRKHRHFYFHFTPTSSSWLNQVERFFALITEGRIRRGTLRSVEELERAIYAWLANWNNKPQPFVWKATADVILDKVRRCKELTGTPH